MEHIHQYDWTLMSSTDTEHFVTAEDLDKCCIEKILRNKFFDPLISSDSDDDQPPVKINWDQVFAARKHKNHFPRVYVPCFHPEVRHPRRSSLSATQHYQCLKVICSQHTEVLEAEFMPRANNFDFNLLEDIKHIYIAEQKEFIEWAKTQWVSVHCLRALKPKPLVEMAYDAEFNMRTHELQSLPKTYEMVAQLPLFTENDCFEFEHQKDLITVNPDDLPLVQFPDMFTKKETILRECSLPTPCDKHPCRFVLPGERSVSILPLTEVHRELAQYAMDNGAQYIASESALRSLLATHRSFTLPVTVCSVVGEDGDSQNIVVLGSEFSMLRQPSLERTYRAFRHLAEYALIPPKEKARALLNRKKGNRAQTVSKDNDTADDSFDGDDDDDENLVIDMDENDTDNHDTDIEEEDQIATEPIDNKSVDKNAEKTSIDDQKAKKSKEIYTCTCEGTWYENPPPRSFRKWRLKSKKRREQLDIIVHCSHKVRSKTGEVILEPIPEFQIDLGGSEQPVERLTSLALSLYLRKNATVMNVRIEGSTGDLATCEYVTSHELHQKLPAFVSTTANRLHTLLSQLQGLLPGNYLLQHQPEHGDNALLHASRPGGSFTLQCDVTRLADQDEAKCVKLAPTLTPVLLPSHKFLKILPCAFSPFPRHLSREGKRPAQRHKTPPRALKWPKRKKKKSASNNN